uniref:Uncharacterized protein n=1 Tax=Chromera velia CCMP2878 TaxID=1169474 RepID=A0A0G4FMY8_9ALVE|eukprot:Cvel_17872.t1-p1 / transcript=Cvel_17872.t1 / gene=Cvel_17872 / organism=Chromera_velia_CCMP2878 / gene_product=hypothetical protein / transcript_product=hypothetical protein / location=Cvel_scaffold1449:42640-44375(-) / protein_length=356 / sequence_SO=supercontig / SO=protein_coding / is_pseudo=false
MQLQDRRPRLLHVFSEVAQYESVAQLWLLIFISGGSLSRLSVDIGSLGLFLSDANKGTFLSSFPYFRSAGTYGRWGRVALQCSDSLKLQQNYKAEQTRMRGVSGEVYGAREKVMQCAKEKWQLSMREGGGDSQIPFLLSVYWRVVEHYRESNWQTLYEILRGAAEGGAREIGWRVLSKIIQKKPELLMEPSVVFHMRELEAETEAEKQAFGEREMDDIDALPVGAGEDKGEEGGWAFEPRVVHSPSPHGQATVIQGGEGSGAADLARRVRSQSADKGAASSFPPFMQTSHPNFPFPSSSVSLQKRPASRPASASLQAPVSQLPSCSSYLRAHQKRRQREKSDRSLREDLPSELSVA